MTRQSKNASAADSRRTPVQPPQAPDASTLLAALKRARTALRKIQRASNKFSEAAELAAAADQRITETLLAVKTSASAGKPAT